MAFRNLEKNSFFEGVVLVAIIGYGGHYLWDNWEVVLASAAGLSITITVVALLFGVVDLIRYWKETKPELPLKLD